MKRDSEYPLLAHCLRETIRHCRWMLLALCVLGVARSALAQAADDAEALFREGLENMRSSNYEAACPKLERSFSLDPTPGALFTLAECDAAWGKVATAVRHYREFVDSLVSMPAGTRKRYEERRGLALEKMAALSPTVPVIRIVVADSRREGLTVKQDGELVEPTTYGVARPVDPGRHEFTAERDGTLVFQQVLDLGAGNHAEVVVAPHDAKPEGASIAIAPAPTPADSSHHDLMRKPRTWMMVGIAVGSVGLAAGVVAGGIALGKKGEIKDHCDGFVCDAKGLDAVNSGQSAATISTTGLVIGFVGAVVATTFGLLKRRDKARAQASTSPQLGFQVGALRTFTLGGTF